MAEIFNYNPDNVSVLIAGIIPVKGFIDGTFVEISKDINSSESYRSSDGIVSRVYNNDQTYTITLTLHNGSETNELLTKLWLLDEATEGKHGKFPLLIKDQSGSDLLFSTTSWIERPATIVKSSSIDPRVWNIRSSQALINVGGNGEVSSLIEDIVNLGIAAIPALEGVL